MLAAHDARVKGTRAAQTGLTTLDRELSGASSLASFPLMPAPAENSLRLADGGIMPMSGVIRDVRNVTGRTSPPPHAREPTLFRPFEVGRNAKKPWPARDRSRESRAALAVAD